MKPSFASIAQGASYGSTREEDYNIFLAYGKLNSDDTTECAGQSIESR